ncbi:MAG: SPOR domain-containing protein [Treponema sp.]|nr:SPOR domain-containing protein [Treponema sp.]
MDKEKKKLLLVAVSVGVFLVILISAAILILTPRSLGGRAAFSSAPIPPGAGGAAFTPPDFNDQTDTAIQTQPFAEASQETNIYFDNEEYTADLDTSRVTIDIPKPTTAAVPDVVETPRPAPVASRPAAAPAQTRPAARVEPARAPAPRTVAAQNRINDYWVQTGAFTAMVRAEGAKELLASKGITSIIENRELDGRMWYRVRVGPYTSETEANYWLALVQSIDGFSESQVRQTVR